MSDVGSRDDTVTKQQGGYKIRKVLGAIAIVFFLAVSPLLAETVLVGTFFNGNNAFLNSRAYIWNPTDADADITARVYTLPRSGNSTLLGTVSLGQLNARSGRNIKIAEDILLAQGEPVTYVSQQLGHATPQITFNRYAHWIPNNSQRKAVNRLPSLSRSRGNVQAEELAR